MPIVVTSGVLVDEADDDDVLPCLCPGLGRLHRLARDPARCDPVPLPGGGEIETLREAGDFIIALPKREHSLPHWQTAMRLLIDAAERGGIVLMAEIAMRQALSHGRPRPEPEPRKKAARKFRIVG